MTAEPNGTWTTRARRVMGLGGVSAALVWSRGETSSHAVVSYDERLRAAASGEGFAVLPD